MPVDYDDLVSHMTSNVTVTPPLTDVADGAELDGERGQAVLASPLHDSVHGRVRPAVRRLALVALHGGERREADEPADYRLVMIDYRLIYNRIFISIFIHF